MRHDELPIDRFVVGGGARFPLLLYHEELQFVQEAWNRACFADVAVWKPINGITRQTINHHR